MPEAAVNKDHSTISWKHHVGLSDNPFPMQTVAKTAAMQTASYEHFRPGVLASDPTHHQPALFWGQNIG